MIEQEVFKMNALSENMLNRLNVLTEQHDEVQLALRDVVARRKTSNERPKECLEGFLMPVLLLLCQMWT